MNAFNYTKDSDDIVVITMDMDGPVNSMNDEFYQSMDNVLKRLITDDSLSGVIFTSAKKTFFAGGDLNQLLLVEPGTEAVYFEQVEACKLLFRQLEKLPVPVVSAINGAALGGGYELCLACNYRIAWNNSAVIIGLPEVSLGLLPGGGGVVRLTNLLGLQSALPYLLEGKKLTAEKALAANMIDQVVNDLTDLLPNAKQWILANKNNENSFIQPWDQKGFRIPGGKSNSPKLAQLLMISPMMLWKSTKGLLPAPEHILDVAIEAARLDFDTALRIESRHFAYLVTTPEAKNMITSFFFQMNKINSGESRPDEFSRSKISKVGILGAGMMGQGIAFASASAEIDVVLKDTSIEAAEKGRAYSEKILDKYIKRGRMSASQKSTILERIITTDSAQDLQGCDLIIEAVFENLELKHELIRDCEKHLLDDGIWGSNTSTLPISRLAEVSSRPENFIGIHFFSPVDKMPLVEIICGNKTSTETLARVFDYVRQINKIPIVVNDSPGFFTSRVFATQLYEAAQMISEGVNPIRIDSLGKLMGMPVGPLTVHDEVSQGLSVDVMESHKKLGLLEGREDPTPDATQLITTIVKEYGRRGRYHNGGYYDYDEGGKQIWPRLLELYHKPNLEISDRDIKDRLLFRSVIESMKCLDEGVISTVADGNIGSIFGIGAPAWTGGYLQFVNTYGLENFISRCSELRAKYGNQFNLPAMIVEKAKNKQLIL